MKTLPKTRYAHLAQWPQPFRVAQATPLERPDSLQGLEVSDSSFDAWLEAGGEAPVATSPARTLPGGLRASHPSN